ncbi:MAG: acetylglutamate kinase [Acutalibacteraceae bacterium]
MRNELNGRQICLMNQLRLLWEQHVYWTRFFIISTAADLPDLKCVTERLFRNPEDFARTLAPIYGNKAASQFQKLLHEHLAIGGELVNAAKNQNQKLADNARKRWYENADCIAAFWASLNCCRIEEKWKCMLYSHLEMTEKEATLRLNGEYAADIKMFDCIEKEALKMADCMFSDILNRKSVC